MYYFFVSHSVITILIKMTVLIQHPLTHRHGEQELVV